MLRNLPIIPTILVLTAAATMVSLGVWQIGRADEKAALIAAYEGAQGSGEIVSFPKEGDGADQWFRRSQVNCDRVMAIQPIAGRSANGAKGWAMRAQCALDGDGQALVDLGFHRGPAPDDPMRRQAEILEEIGMPSSIVMRHATPHFAHVFSGDGYSSGYYSYMWSEVMDADAFEGFLEAGDAFDPTMAHKLETFVLSAGSIQDEAQAYIDFRGRLPGVDALLKGRGLAA